MMFLTVFLAFLELGTFFCLLVSLSLSEVENLATVMLSMVLARSNFSTKVSISPVSGMKPYEINMALWILGVFLAIESTSSDSSCY